MSRFTRFVPPTPPTAASAAGTRVRVSVECRPNWTYPKLRLLIGAELAARHGLTPGGFAAISCAEEEGRQLLLIEKAGPLDEGAVSISGPPGRQKDDEGGGTRLITISGLPGVPEGKRAAQLAVHKQVAEGLIVTLPWSAPGLPESARTAVKAAKDAAQCGTVARRVAPPPAASEAPDIMASALQLGCQAFGLHPKALSSGAKLSPERLQIRDLIYGALTDGGIAPGDVAERLGMDEKAARLAPRNAERVTKDQPALYRKYHALVGAVSDLPEKGGA